MRRLALAAALAWCSLALADTASLTWTYPTRNVDGSALVDLADFRVFRRCDAAPLVVLATVPASTSAPNGGESSGYVDAAPAGSTCWYSVTARNAGGEESARTGEVSKTFAADLPGDVSATFTWQIADEPGPPNVTLAFSNLTANTDATLTGTSDTAATASITVPANGVVYLAIAVAQGSAGADRAPTVTGVTGASLTWTSLVRQIYGSRRSISVFRAINTGSEQSGALTISMSSENAGALQEVMWSADLVTGADTTTPNDTVVSANGSDNLNLADIGTLDTGDAAYSAGALEDGGSSFALSGWTALGSRTAGANVRQLKTYYDDSSPDETPSWTSSGSGNGVGAIAFIVNVGAGGGVGATVNRASETDTAQAIARSKSKAIGQAAESDFAQAVARYKARVAALAAETDTARAVGKAKARTAAQAAESDASRTITPAGAPVGGTVTQALETDAARTLSSSKAKAIGQAAELDLVQTILRVKARAVGQALEGDSARPISLPGSIGGTLSQAIESDLARSVGKAKAKAIAQALETDAGRAIAAMRAYAVGRASETDAAIAVAAIGKALALGVATEQDIARAFTVSGGAPVDFYYLREALEMAAASIIAALANTTVTVDVGGAGETSGVVAIQQERSFDPGLPGLRMASTSTEFLLEKKTAPASLKQGTLIRDETSLETYRVRRLNYNRGGIVTVEIERV